MSIKLVPMYTVICDRCGKDAFGGDCDFCAWLDKDHAVEIARDTCGWETIDDKHYCPDCLVWDEEEDERVPKPVIS